MLKKILEWQDPLLTANTIYEDSSYKDNWVFLYSGLSNKNTNSYSYLALYSKEEIISDNFNCTLNKNNSIWLGYLGYDLKNSLEELTKDQEYFIKLPNLWLTNFNLILKFDHKNHNIICLYQEKEFLTKIPKELEIINNNLDFNAKCLKSNFSKLEYLSKVKQIKNKIANGDIYQANLTRKFCGEFTKPINRFSCFITLSKLNPTNYSSFLKKGDNYIISTSPELFLSIDKYGNAISSPIKGTTPRDDDKSKDIVNKNHLSSNQKEIAENLMIVDLVRNDLSRSCVIDSITVDNMFKVSEYSNVYHMSSDIKGKKNNQLSNLELIKNCFPPASMTGVPKIKAMEICSELEKYKRGVYSGAIGLISSKECVLSVVIRTLLLQKNKFEFQIGGAITFDSDPESEWIEIVSKAKTITNILGISLTDFDN